MKNTLPSICFLAASLALLAGCSGPLKPDGFPDTFPTVITITQEGEPLAKATVKLVPADGARDWMTSAMTDESGQAVIFTYGRFAGAPKGVFKVVVTKTESDVSRYNPPDDTTDEHAMAIYNRNVMNERLNDYTLVEAVYDSPDTTPLELEIKGRTTQTFDVGKKARVVVSN